MNGEDGQERKWHTLAVLLGLLVIGISFIFVSALIRSRSEFWSTTLRDIGFVFSPIAILALLYQYVAEQRHSRFVAKHIVSDILEELDDRRGGRTGLNEVVAIHPNRRVIDFQKFFGSANHQIDILTTNFNSLSMYIGLLVSKANNGTQVRVLTLNPRHEFVARRAGELRLTVQGFFNELRSSLLELCTERENKLRRDRQGNCTVKIYDNTPSLTLFRSDNRLIVGFLFQQGRGRSQMHIQFEGSRLFCPSKCKLQVCRARCCQYFMNHFGMIWKQAEQMTAEKAESLRR